MSVSALSASTAGAPVAEHQRDLGGKPSGGSKFSALVSALETLDAQANAQATAGSPSASGQGVVATTSDPSLSLDATLAGLVSRAAGSSGGVLWRASGARGSSSEQSSSDSTTTTQSGAQTTIALSGLAYGALGALAASAQLGSQSTGATSASQSNAASLGSLTSTARALNAAAAGNGALASSVLAGAVGAADAADETTMAQTITGGLSDLNATSIQSRTFLGVDSAASSEAKSPLLRTLTRAATGSSSASAATATTTSVALDGAATASVQTEASADKHSDSRHPGSGSGASSDSSASAATTAANVVASSSAADSVVAAAVGGAGTITVDQLPDVIASEASALQAQTAASASTATPGSGQAVKELQIDLEPAQLGAVSVKMRIAKGQLSVVVEVAQPTTLKAIEGERDTIADRLGVSAQSIEIIVAPSAANQASASNSETSNNAPNQNASNQENAQSDPNQGSQSNGQQSSRRDGAAGRWPGQASAQAAASGGGFGDLVV